MKMIGEAMGVIAVVLQLNIGLAVILLENFGDFINLVVCIL